MTQVASTGAFSHVTVFLRTRYTYFKAMYLSMAALHDLGMKGIFNAAKEQVVAPGAAAWVQSRMHLRRHSVVLPFCHKCSPGGFSWITGGKPCVSVAGS